MDIAAYYFPNYHADKRNEEYRGPGWTEWELMKCARPRFEGHRQPKIPAWGYEDEADPKVMAKKIATAQKYKVDGFIFDWYWYDGPYLERALTELELLPNIERAEIISDNIYLHCKKGKNIEEDIFNICLEHGWYIKNLSKIELSIEEILTHVLNK